MIPRILPGIDWLGHSADTALQTDRCYQIVNLALQTLRTGIFYFPIFTFYSCSFQGFVCVCVPPCLQPVFFGNLISEYHMFLFMVDTFASI